MVDTVLITVTIHLAEMTQGRKGLPWLVFSEFPAHHSEESIVNGSVATDRWHFSGYNTVSIIFTSVLLSGLHSKGSTVFETMPQAGEKHSR